MSILINHCWCSDSNWGGHYDCRVIVTIDRIAEGKTYYDPPTTDWTNLIEKVDLEWKQFGDSHATYRLKQEVVDWLNANIQDRKTPKYHAGGTKGWAMGTDKYNENSGISFNIFFESARQAAKFIKQWSSFKKPVDSLNYFKDIRRKLDITTNRMKRVPR